MRLHHSTTTTGNIYEAAINNPLAPYVTVVSAWLFVWWLQMDVFSFLNVAPGVELPFFPAGVRTLAVFVFGIHGAVAILIGSLITYEWLFPAVAMSNYLGVASIAAASSFSAFIAMKLYLFISKTAADLSELTYQKIIAIVLTQSLLSSTLHQIIYHTDKVSDTYIQIDPIESLKIWSAMAAGDLIGSMIVMLGMCLVVDLLSKLRHRDL